MKVFISYAREDWEIAEKVRSDLKRAGIDAWIDRKELKPGQRWKAEISRAIRNSSYFIALLSSHSVSKKGFFQTELKKALDILDEMPEHDIYFIPVRIDNCEPNHEKLEDIHWADLFPSYEEGLSQILSVLVPDSSETIQPQNIPEKPAEPAPIISNPKVEKNAAPQPPKPKYQLRSKPMTVSYEEALKAFKLKVSDGLWKPLEYIQNDFKDNGDGTVSDYATGLMWQKSGFDNYMSYKDTEAYVDELNSRKFAGYSDWRLPTVDELKSLLTPKEMNGDLFIDPIFDKTQRWCWTSDKRASGGVWLVDFYDGDVYWYDDDRYYVRAVRSRQ
jgi:hypothetical protein